MKLAVVFLAIAALVAPAVSAQMSPQPGGTPTFDSGDLTTGDTFSWTFNETGTFQYHCKHHPNMKGTVQVTAGSPAAGAVGIAASTFTPATVMVGPGGTVTWTNADTATHTVTADLTRGGANATHDGAKNHTRPNATFDRVPPEAAQKGLSRAEDARLFAKLNYSNGMATGRFVSFNYSESTGEVTDYKVGGWNGSVFASVMPDPWKANGTPKVHGAVFQADADQATLDAHNNPTASLHLMAFNSTNVTFELGDGVTVDANNSTTSAWRLMDGGGRHGHLALLGNATATTDNATITVHLGEGDGVLFLAHPDKDQSSASSLHGVVAQAKRVGSVLNVADGAACDAASSSAAACGGDGTPVEDELPLTAHAETRSLAKGRAVVNVSSGTSDGKLVVIRFANGTFSGGKLKVTVANESVDATDGGSDASGPIASAVAGGKAAAVVTFTANSTEVAVFVPHFSDQTVTIEESGDGATPSTTPTGGTTAPTGTTTGGGSKGVPGFTIGLSALAAAIAIALLERRR